MKVVYESKADWNAKTDYLRCSPSFHGSPRYDFVLIDTAEGEIFAQLQFIFICKVNKIEYPLALIHPYDKLIKEYPQKDIDFGLYRIRATTRKSTEIISVESIIRGALVVSDFETDDHYFVIDSTDSDMFLRMQELLSKGIFSSPES